MRPSGIKHISTPSFIVLFEAAAFEERYNLCRLSGMFPNDLTLRQFQLEKNS